MTTRSTGYTGVVENVGSTAPKELLPKCGTVIEHAIRVLAESGNGLAYDSTYSCVANGLPQTS